MEKLMGGVITVFIISSLLVTYTYIIRNQYLRQNLQQNRKSEVEMIFTGDVMLGRTVMSKSLELKDPAYPIRKVASELKSADLVLANLENPIVENCPLHYDGFIFCATPNMLQALTEGGVDVVNLANNHTLNYGSKGFEETKKHLDDVNIRYTGAGELHTETVNGTTFGFLGFDKSQQSNPVLTEEERNWIADSDAKVDVLIISMHWGVEYQDTALTGQEKLAKELVTLGADVVVGHHPHWVQNVEYIDDVPVYYSLGNFIFDQMFEDNVRSGLVVKLSFNSGKISKEEFLHTYMKDWSQPEFNIGH